MTQNMWSNLSSNAFSYTPIPRSNLNIQRVLIVEDDPFSRKLFHKILSDQYENLDIVFSSTYRGAVAAYKAHPSYDLVILDIFLGEDRSGVDFFKEIIAMPEDSKPIVIMTSALEQADYLKLFPQSLPAPPYLKKPFRAEACIDLVEVFTGGELK